MSKIKAIVLDVDGTLTNRDKEIPPLTKRALLQAQAMGIYVILASGRTTAGLIRYGHELRMEQHNGLFIAYNGAKVINFQTKEELFSQAMSVAESQAVLEHMKNFDVRPMIDRDDYMYVNDVFNSQLHAPDGSEVNIIKYEARSNGYKLCDIDDLAAFADFPLNKILTAGESDYLKDHWQAMMEPFQGTLNGMFTGPFYFEFTALGIDKAKALDTVIQTLHLQREEVIAFGDGHNDISILQAAGIGVAMANAVPELKAIADEITLSNDEEGIAVSLYCHIPELVQG